MDQDAEGVWPGTNALTIYIICVFWIACAPPPRPMPVVRTAKDERCAIVNRFVTNVALDPDASEDWKVLARVAHDIWTDECT